MSGFDQSEGIHDELVAFQNRYLQQGHLYSQKYKERYQEMSQSRGTNRRRDENNITKTYLYNFDPLKPHFYIVKSGVYKGIHYFSYFCSKT